MDTRNAAVGWLALGAFVLYGSYGVFAGDGPRTAPPPGVSWADIAQNVLLYVPFGILGVKAMAGRGYRGLALPVLVTGIAFVYSSTIELLQTLSAFRIASPLDVTANVIGAAVGAIAAKRPVLVTAGQVRLIGVLEAPERYVLAAVLGAIVVAAWYPFDVTLDVSTLSDRTRAIRLDPWLWPPRAQLWAQGARYFVVAAILSVSLSGGTTRRAAAAALAATTAAVVIDLGQLAMGSQPIGVAAFASQAAGGCTGAVTALMVTGRRGTRYAAA